MDLPLDDPWLIVFTNFTVFGSVAACIYAFARWRRHGDVLAWQPRRPVPWGPPAAILAFVLALMAMSSAFSTGAAPPEPHERDATSLAANLVAWIISQLVITGSFFAVIVIVYRATWDDFALPHALSDGLRDVGIGLLAGIASLLPIRLVQGFLLWLLGRPDPLSQHPLIESLLQGGGPNALVMLLAFFSAVIAAPVCEEVVYRLLLQGWLEKWEDDWTGWRRPPNCVDELMVEGPPIGPAGEIAQPSPPRPGAFGLPYGWLPIFASSFLFGLAHFGYGPEPIPLFLFGMVLGYVFQRTHRIVPCIVAHALFNFVSMVMLWRIVVLTAE